MAVVTSLLILTQGNFTFNFKLSCYCLNGVLMNKLWVSYLWICLGTFFTVHLLLILPCILGYCWKFCPICKLFFITLIWPLGPPTPLPFSFQWRSILWLVGVGWGQKKDCSGSQAKPEPIVGNAWFLFGNTIWTDMKIRYLCSPMKVNLSTSVLTNAILLDNIL